MASTSSAAVVPAPVKPVSVPGEYEVAHLTDVVHLNTVETVTGVAPNAAVNTFTNTDLSLSSHHSLASGHSTSSFWKGNLFLTNYALSFIVTDGASAGHHSAGFHVAADGPNAMHPNLDAANAPLMHIPVGSIWKMEYNKYSGSGGKSHDKEKEKEREAAEKQASAAAAAANNTGAGGGDYSAMGSASTVAPVIHSSVDSDLKDIAFQLTLYCRDARVLSFGILRRASPQNLGIISGSGGSNFNTNSAQALEDRQANAAEFMRLLKKYSFPKDVKKVFAFSYLGGAAAKADRVKSSGKYDDGWNTYDIGREFARMGIGNHPADASLGVSLIHPRRKAKWKLDAITNAKFEFSPTYPAAFWIPADLTDKELGKVKSFRSKGRLPALVYNYSDLLDYKGLGLDPLYYPDTVILRSAQPNVGWTFGRCNADEHLLELAEVRVIIDARPYANAVANQAKGGGYENAENYKDCKIEFMNIENIHVMRDALNKMLDSLKANHLNAYNTGGSTQVGDDWWGAMQQSGWLKHVRILLEGALVCANYVKNGTSILIHCSDGWDRTSQLTSLAQIILDPYYRTRAGFGVLVEKEWVAFGHQFYKRCGHGEKDTHHADERSPIFFQFLDAIWQIMQQFPFAFEFNADYLGAVADHLYSNKFGTFLSDNERLRTTDKVRESTHSVWSEVNHESKRKMFRNPLYGKGGVAVPPSAVASNGPNSPIAVANNPGMQLSALSGADLGKAAFLHVSADPRRISIWPYWYRWERRKQGHVPHSHHLGEHGFGACSHMHNSALTQLASYARASLQTQKIRAQAREEAMLSALAALEADVARMNALLQSQGASASSLRQSPPWRPEQALAHLQLVDSRPPSPNGRHASPSPTPPNSSPNSSSASSSGPNSFPAGWMPPLPSGPRPATGGPPPLPNGAPVKPAAGAGGPPPVPSSRLPPRVAHSPSVSASSSMRPPPLNDDEDDDLQFTNNDAVGDGESAWHNNPLSANGRASMISTTFSGENIQDELQGNAVDPRKFSIIAGTGQKSLLQPAAAGPTHNPKLPPPRTAQSMAAAAAAAIAAEAAASVANANSGSSASNAPSIPAVALPRHRVLYNFQATDPGQVSMNKSSLVEVVEKGELGWWKIKNEAGEVGMAPANRIEMTPQTNVATVVAAGAAIPSSNTVTSPPSVTPAIPSAAAVPPAIPVAAAAVPPSPSHSHTGPTPPPVPVASGPPPVPSSAAAAIAPAEQPKPEVPAVGVPQFRVNAAVFSGVKLKTTQKRASTIAREKKEKEHAEKESALLTADNPASSSASAETPAVELATQSRPVPPPVPQ